MRIRELGISCMVLQIKIAKNIFVLSNIVFLCCDKFQNNISYIMLSGVLIMGSRSPLVRCSSMTNRNKKTPTMGWRAVNISNKPTIPDYSF